MLAGCCFAANRLDVGIAVKKTYQKPVLVKRELLSVVTAAPVTSGR